MVPPVPGGHIATRLHLTLAQTTLCHTSRIARIGVRCWALRGCWTAFNGLLESDLDADKILAAVESGICDNICDLFDDAPETCTEEGAFTSSPWRREANNTEEDF